MQFNQTLSKSMMLLSIRLMINGLLARSWVMLVNQLGSTKHGMKLEMKITRKEVLT